MTLKRRDLIKFATGGACGAVLTPVPWKLLDDSANWSQNWSWTPRVPQGEVKVKFSTCTICPSGCGVKARCVGDRAVGIQGAAGHPFSHGTLCPVGLAGHTLAYHPRRIRPAIKPQAALSEVARRVRKGERVAILDLGGERAMSALYRQAAEAFGNAVYLRAPDRQEATLNAVAELLGRAPGSLGLDLEHTRTLVSFGAPVLEGWATPGRVMQRWRTGELRIIQVEPRQSRTALAAETWIPAFDLIFPLRSGAAPCAAADPWTASSQAVSEAAAGPAPLSDTSNTRRYLRNGVESPAVFIGSGDDPARERAIAAMNLTLGTIGGEGGIVPRSALPWEHPAAQEIGSVPDGSIGVLFIDSSRAVDALPWPVIRRKLSEGAMVVALAYREDAFTAHANVTLPVAAPFEALEDAATPPCAAIPSFAIAPPLIHIQIQAAGATPLDHLNAILEAAGKVPVRNQLEDELKQRAAAIHAAKIGTVVSYSDGSAVKIAGIASPGELWKKLSEGACWLGEPCRDELLSKPVLIPPPPGVVADAGRPFTLVVYGSPDETAPLSSKLYQESALYTPSEVARMHPDTAAAIGVKTGENIVIDTLYGARQRQLLADPAVMPGVVEATTGIADICTDGSPANWRVVAANVRRA